MSSQSEILQLNDHQHVRQRIGQYAGDPEWKKRTTYLYDGSQIYESSVSIPYSIEHLFMEILSNAVDNVRKSRDDGQAYINISTNNFAD